MANSVERIMKKTGLDEDSAKELLEDAKAWIYEQKTLAGRTGTGTERDCDHRIQQGWNRRRKRKE